MFFAQNAQFGLYIARDGWTIDGLHMVININIPMSKSQQLHIRQLSKYLYMDCVFKCMNINDAFNQI